MPSDPVLSGWALGAGGSCSVCFLADAAAGCALTVDTLCLFLPVVFVPDGMRWPSLMPDALVLSLVLCGRVDPS